MSDGPEILLESEAPADPDSAVTFYDVEFTYARTPFEPPPAADDGQAGAEALEFAGREESSEAAETADPVKSDKFKAEFMAYCLKSKTEQGRLHRKVAVVKFRDV